MSMTETLEKARELIADEAHWTTKTFARTANELECGSGSSDAVQWCAMGAAWNIVFNKGGTSEVTAMLQDSALAVYDYSLTYVNDRLGHAAVLKVYDHAIEASREK